jgi:putative MATE family efflux protein
LIALMSMMDTMMVGVVGPHAIAAVGLVTQPRFIVLTLISALNAAVTTITARRKGENDPDAAVSCLKQSLLLCTGIAIVLSFVAFRGRTPLLMFTGAQDDTLELARQYFELILLGTPINAISMTICAAQRGIGSTRTSLVVHMTANLVNLVLNFLLIGGRMGFPALGVRGAAIATVIGWGVGFVLALYSILHKHAYLYVVGRDGWLPDKPTLRSLYVVASGTFLEQICMRVGFLANTIVVAGLGTMMFAAHNICMNILSLSFSFGEGFGIAATSLVGQNLGAKRPDLSIMYGKVCQRYSFITSTIMLILFATQGGTLVRLFTGEPDILAVSRAVLLIAAVVLFGQSSQMIFMGSLRGAGDTRYTAVVSLICIVLIRPILGYVLAYPLGLGLIGIWLTFIIDQYLRLTLTIRRFSSGKWMGIEL